MKEQINELVKSFGENSRIGDVMQRMTEVLHEQSSYEAMFPWETINVRYNGLKESPYVYQLTKYWYQSSGGFTPSLQEIVEGTFWVESKGMKCTCRNWSQDICPGCKANKSIQVPTDPNTRNLFSFLLGLGL